ncbi:MAG: hypothetical protein JNK15_22900 [Planctomycetes bacterium]|nr:hypothetical protein [Planctomycetota bacterium]
MAGKRQRFADRLLLVTNLVVANLAAAFWVALFVQPGLVGLDLGPVGAAFGDMRIALLPLSTPVAWIALFVGIAVVLWNFAWLVRRSAPRPPSNWITSETPSGLVRIAREALEFGLQKAGEALPEVTRIRVHVDNRQQKRILVTAQFHCAEGANNLAASQRLRQALGDRFTEMVRPVDGTEVDFDLEFQGFAGKLGKKGAELPPPEPPPFTGPKYPIDDDSGGVA